jgi:hypothetical protein
VTVKLALDTGAGRRSLNKSEPTVSALHHVLSNIRWKIPGEDVLAPKV